VEESIRTIVEGVALAIEAAAALMIAIGAVQAVFYSLAWLVGRPMTLRHRKDIWINFAMWLLLALEFELAADILRSAISPNWTDIGQLAAIAVIRTFLNYFLERDIENTTGAREKGGAHV